jgi:hypothetical protein
MHGDAMSTWFAVVEGRKSGPLPTEQLAAVLADRDLAAILVWRHGFDGWKPASEVPELKSPPPVRSDAGETSTTPMDRHRKRIAAWTLAGAFIGVAVLGLRLVTGKESSSDPDFLFDYFGAGLVGGAFAGLVLGAIADLIAGRRTGGRSKARPEAGALQPPPLPQDATHETIPATAGRLNFIIRHWRGDFPLWISFWVITVVGSLLLGVLIVVVGVAIGGGDNDSLRRFFVAVAGASLTAFLLAQWQLVGTWRSAFKYKQARIRSGRSGVWGDVTYLVVVPASLSVVGGFLSLSYALKLLFPIIFLNDPEMANYSIRVMRGGTEVEITGGFKHGLIEDFTKVLDSSKQIRVVHLDSPGGRDVEGRRMFDLIRQRGLITYVSSDCASACTLAFAGGRERFLRPGATLGFHRAGLPGLLERSWRPSAADDLFEESARHIYKTAGFDAAFIDKASVTPHSDIWEPSSDVLISAGVVTGPSDGRQFALSGMGAELTRKDVEESLGKIAALRTMKSLYPIEFEVFVDEYHDGALKGKTEAEAIEKVAARIGPFVASKIALAHNDVLVDYSKLLLEQYIALGARNPTDCYLYASGSLNVVPWLPANLKRLDDDIRLRGLSTAQQQPAIDEADVARILGKVRTQVLLLGTSNDDLALLNSKMLASPQHAAYCDVTIKYFRELSQLPAQETALAMRSILSPK